MWRHRKLHNLWLFSQNFQTFFFYLQDLQVIPHIFQLTFPRSYVLLNPNSWLSSNCFTWPNSISFYIYLNVFNITYCIQLFISFNRLYLYFWKRKIPIYLSQYLFLMVLENIWPKSYKKGEWIRLDNEGLQCFFPSPNIVRVIKSRSWRWTRHVKARSVFKIVRGVTTAREPIRKPMHR